MTILAFVIILGILVFVHELGHFVVARRSGIAVEEFGFGFPPRIIGWKRGGTEYTLNWIPFGGFVRLQGEAGDEKQRPDSFSQARFSRQLAVMAAGVTMNALLAWVLISFTLVLGVRTDATTVPHDRYAHQSNTHVEVQVSDGGAAIAAGLRSSDVVVSINDQHFTTTDQIITYAKANNYPVFHIVVQRASRTKEIIVTPHTDPNLPRYGLGIQNVTTVRYAWYIAPWYGLQSTGQLIGQTLQGFWKLLHDLVVTASVSSDVSGPVGIAVLTGQVIQYGFAATVQFMAILSISLAVVNFLPLPALDGGRALFLVIGKFRGRPVDTKIENTVHTIGFYGLLLVIILLSIRDVSKFRLLEQIRLLFR